MAVADRRQRCLGILDTGDMHQPGQLGEKLLLTRQVMVKGVVDEPEHIQPTDNLDRFHRRAFKPQRAFFETQRLDETENAVIAQDRRQFTQGGAQP